MTVFYQTGLRAILEKKSGSQTHISTMDSTLTCTQSPGQLFPMGAQLGVPYGHMGCRQFGVQFGYLDVYDLPFCVPYDVVLLLDVPVVLFCVPYYVVFFLLDVPMDLCTQLYSPVQCTMYSTWLSMYLKYQT